MTNQRQAGAPVQLFGQEFTNVNGVGGKTQIPPAGPSDDGLPPL